MVSPGPPAGRLAGWPAGRPANLAGLWAIWAVGSGVGAVGCGLWAVERVGYGLWAVGCRLWAMDCGKWAVANRE